MEQVSSESDLADSSMEDTREDQSVEEFTTSGCGCHLGPENTPCAKYLTQESVQKCRQDCLGLTRDELDLVVFSQIHSLRSTPEQPTLHQSHHVTGTKSRSEFYAEMQRECNYASNRNCI